MTDLAPSNPTVFSKDALMLDAEAEVDRIVDVWGHRFKRVCSARSARNRP